eukprot:gene24311-9915_t
MSLLSSGAIQQQWGELELVWCKCLAHHQEYSLVYTAPERYSSNGGELELSKESDVFSFGLIMYELFTTSLINPTNEGQEWHLTSEMLHSYADRVANGFREPIPEYWPDNLKELVGSCWEQDPSMRPNMGTIIRRLQAFKDDSDVIDALIPKHTMDCWSKGALTIGYQLQDVDHDSSSVDEDPEVDESYLKSMLPTIPAHSSEGSAASLLSSSGVELPSGETAEYRSSAEDSHVGADTDCIQLVSVDEFDLPSGNAARLQHHLNSLPRANGDPHDGRPVWVWLRDLLTAGLPAQSIWRSPRWQARVDVAALSVDS